LAQLDLTVSILVKITRTVYTYHERVTYVVLKSLV
jgi:hypothetical protein